MKHFKRAMVAMDLTEMDARLLSFVEVLLGLFTLRKLYVVHIMPDFTLPDNLDAQFHKLFAPEHPIDERIKQKIAQDVQKTISDRPGLDTIVNVVEGIPYEKLIHWTKVKEIDLLIVGHKEVSDGSGITAKRVARTSRCNVIFVPESFNTELQTIVVPTDFSENSARALKLAINLRNFLPNLEIEALYVVDLPPDSYYIQSTENEGFKSLLVDAAQETFNDFLKKHDIAEDEVKPVFLENDYVNIAAHLEDYVNDKHPDLVIMGARGHTLLQNFFYGSVTEKFVDRCKEVPVMIVR